MKRFTVFLFVLLFVSKIFAQTNELTDAQIKDVLVTQNIFGEYLKFKNDNTFVSDYRTKGGDGYNFEGKYSILGADPEIPIPGFMVLNSKRHINSVSDLSKEERYEIINVISLAEKALKELNIVEEVTLVQEERSMHLHIWIFPNYKWMTEKFGKGIKYLRDISEYAKNNVKEKDIKEILEVIDKIREYFKEHSI